MPVEVGHHETVSYDPDQLRSRREEARSKARRSRVAVGAALALVLAGVGAAVALSSGSAGTGSTTDAGNRATTPASTAAATHPTGSTAPKWTQPLASPAQQAAAVARFVRIGKPIYCAGGRRGRYVALTFDDGPGPYTHFAMKKLKKWHSRATFFLVGDRLSDPAWQYWAKKETYLAATGDHSWTHPYLPGLDAAAVHSQIFDTRNKAQSVSGNRVMVFRPPYGARTPQIDAIAAKANLAEIIWDVDSEDSQGANYAGIARNVIAGLKPGSIILMHENRGQTIRALPQILQALKRRHLTAVTVPEMLAIDPPTDAQIAAGPNGCTALRGQGSLRAGA